MITKSYTIEITEGTAKLTTSNKNISFNQNDVGTSFIKFVCKKSDGTNENLTGLTARVCVKTPSLDAEEQPVVVAQDSNITIDDVNGTIEVELEQSLIDTVGTYTMQLQLLDGTDVYTYSPKITYTVNEVITVG